MQTVEQINKRRGCLSAGLSILRRELENLNLNEKQIQKKRARGLRMVTEFTQLTDDLKKLGKSPTPTAPYLFKEYWEDKTPKESLKRSSQHKKIVPKGQDSESYALYLAWSKTPQQSELDIIIGYINMIGLEKISEESYDNECVVRYKIQGNENEFNIIKKSIQYLIDFQIHESDLSVYGKKFL
ncbi:MAG: hypothetical protein IKU29_06410 [Parabacteroides sp.]|nr:hypothetical protein [Parabacteroides sp.]